MPPHQTIRALLAAGTSEAEEQQRGQARLAARLAWIDEILAAWLAGHDKVRQAWDRLLDDLPDDLDDEEFEAMDLPDPPEQAELDAIQAQIDAVRERDMWPRELYFGGV